MPLPSAEARILQTLAKKPNAPVHREDLIPEHANVRLVDVQILRLRQKIEENPRFPRYLQTIRGTGYALVPD